MSKVRPTWRALTFRSSSIAAALMVALSTLRAENPAAPANVDYPSFQTGGSLTGVLPAAPVPPLKTRWSYKTKDRSAFEGGPVIAGDSVYLGDADGTLRALDLATGKEKWIYEISPAILVTPLVHRGIVYFGDGGGSFHAVDAATGKKLWIFETEGGIHDAANIAKVGDKEVLVFCNDAGKLHCIDLAGKELWSARADDRLNSTPAVSEGNAYIAGCDGKLRKIDLATGKELAMVRMIPHLAPASAPATQEDKPKEEKKDASPATAPAKDDEDFDGGGLLSPGSPVVDSGSVIVATDKGHVFSYDQKTLKLQWDYNDVEDESMVFATPAATPETVVVGARDHNIHAIDRATGKRKWIVRLRDDMDSPALIANQRVYIAGHDSKFYVLDLKTGQKLATIGTPKPVSAPLAATAKVVIVADSHGNVLCLESEK